MVQVNFDKYRRVCLLITFVSLLLLVLTSNLALADGKGHHPDKKMSEHMQAMMAAKEGVPEEYKIMERTPIMPDEDSLQLGNKLFLQNCSVCHGEKGNGKGPAAAGLKTKPANFLDVEHSATYGPGDKYWIIGNGTGSTGMPGFAQLTPVQRWNLVNHIMQLQQGVQ